jgi:hypothetical protein
MDLGVEIKIRGCEVGRQAQISSRSLGKEEGMIEFTNLGLKVGRSGT